MDLLLYYLFFFGFFIFCLRCNNIFSRLLVFLGCCFCRSVSYCFCVLFKLMFRFRVIFIKVVISFMVIKEIVLLKF